MILISGANGVIGSALKKLLEKERIEYQLLTNEIFNFKRVDLDLSFSDKNTKVIHLAASLPKPPNRQDSLENSQITRLLDNSVYNFVSKREIPVIYFSGCSIYSKEHQVYCDESTPLNTEVTSPYLQAKLAGDRLFSDLEFSTVLRISSPLSPNLPDHLVVKKFIRQAISGEELYVQDNGSREQDFIDVEDIANAVHLTLVKDIFGTFNVCSGNPTTMLDLAISITKIVGKGDIRVESFKDVEGGNTAKYCNCKTCLTLGWFPQINLDNSITKIVKSL